MSALPTTLLNRLKQETAEVHVAIERSVRFLDADATVSDYGNYLAQLLGFYAPIENRLVALCAKIDCTAMPIDMEGRCKAHLIAQDLRRLGRTECALMQLPRCGDDELPPLQDLQQALGCLYVLEGATLGGRYVSHRLSQRFPDTMTTAGAFLRCYGNETRARWLAYGQALAQHAEDPQRIVRSAQQTFLALHNWLRAR